MRIREVVAGLVIFGALGLVSCESSKEEVIPTVERDIKAEQKPTQEKKKEVKVKKEGAYALADSKGCFACHGVDRKKVGPAYTEVAKRYAGKEGAIEELVTSMIKGSMGKWGSIPMTPQPVSKEEAEELARWILSLK